MGPSQKITEIWERKKMGITHEGVARGGGGRKNRGTPKTGRGVTQGARALARRTKHQPPNDYQIVNREKRKYGNTRETTTNDLRHGIRNGGYGKKDAKLPKDGRKVSRPQSGGQKSWKENVRFRTLSVVVPTLRERGANVTNGD